MKLRKAAGKALLDLDDPCVEESGSEYTTDSEAENYDEGLSAVEEEEEDEGEGCDSEDELREGGPRELLPVNPECEDGHRGIKSGSVENVNSLVADVSDSEAMTRRSVGTDDEEEEEEEEEDEGGDRDEEAPALPAFNRFSLLTSDDEEGEEEHGMLQLDGTDQQDAQSSDEGEQQQQQQHDNVDGATGARQAKRSEAARRRRQRRRQRQREQRQEQRALMGAAGGHTREGGDTGETRDLPTSAARAPRGLTHHQEAASAPAGLRACSGGCLESASPEETPRAWGTVADGVGAEAEAFTAECWLCYGEGRVLGSSSECGKACKGKSSPAHAGADDLESDSGSDGHSKSNSNSEAAHVASERCCGDPGGVPSAAEGILEERQEGKLEDLVAPCRVCAGGLQYIHRRCLARWLEASWALACPNCRTVYDSAVLDAHTEGPSARSMMLSSLPPGHNPMEPFLPRTQVYFCVGNTVELSMNCGGVSAVEVLRRIRLLVDDMAGHGGDGGLGLVRSDGTAVELPNFNVTSLVVALPENSAQGNGRPGQQASRSGRQPDGTFWSPRFSNEDYDYDDYDSDYGEDYGEDYDEDWQDDGPDGRYDSLPPLVPARGVPPAAVRERSFTSASRQRLTEERIRSLVDQMSGWDARADMLGLDSASYALENLRVAGPTFPGGPQHASTRGADRAVQRAEQQRRRADMLAQQRSQQRYSRGHQSMSGPPRGSGNRRR